VPIRECHIIDPALADLHASLDIDPEGFAAVQLRAGVRAGEAMLVFETEDEAPPEIEVDLPVSAALLLPDGEAATLIGETVLVEEVRGRAFRVSPGSFFQVNTPVADLLVERVLGYLAPQGGETVLDAYCGAGLFSAFCAPHCARLIGIEASAGACADFAANLDEFDNVELYQGMVEYVLPELVAGGLRADAAVLDPPRAGCAPEVLQAFVDAGVKRLVYVSCDIATHARDIKRLAALGYRFVEAQPVDMFPQTYHIESITLLEK
jgi:23S rRNA (uracil1939-C5)-methyltransferase